MFMHNVPPPMASPATGH